MSCKCTPYCVYQKEWRLFRSRSCLLGSCVCAQGAALYALQLIRGSDKSTVQFPEEEGAPAATLVCVGFKAGSEVLPPYPHTKTTLLVFRF